MTRAAELYEKIDIQAKSVARGSDFGEEQITWTNLYASVWANVTPQSGVEQVRADERVMVRRVNVLTRWKSGITTDMRIRVADGRIFQIISAVEIPRRRFLEFVCEEYSV